MSKQCPHCKGNNPNELEKCQWCGKGFDDMVVIAKENKDDKKNGMNGIKVSEDREKKKQDEAFEEIGELGKEEIGSVRKIIKEFKKFLKELWWLGEKPKKYPKPKSFWDLSQLSRSTMTLKEIKVYLQDFYKRLKERKLRIGEVIEFSLYEIVFLIFLYNGLLVIFPTIHENIYIQKFTSSGVNFLLLICFFYWLLINIQGVFLIERSNGNVSLLITLGIIFPLSMIIMYFFDLLVGFDAKEIQLIEYPIHSPGLWFSFLISPIYGFIVYILVKNHLRKKVRKK
ncbi:MAG: hypothetical protein AB1349_13205 [Elusimicrobiota bacterium]